ncbi:MAG: hypothetical protein KC590_06460 [Nitrospira sp.]|nr:hypothetical protein [Nitrospira sp.]
MASTLAEHTLSKICDYLSAMGISLTRDVTLHALALVEEGLASQATDPASFVMKRVREHFGIHDLTLPPAAPPIKRGSMRFEQ